MDGRVVDLHVDGGRFVSGGEARDSIDVAGRLVTPPLVDCHLHLDASLTVGRQRFNESGTLIEGIHVWGELKPSLTEQDVFERASEIVRWSAAQGTLFIRAHADVSGDNDAMVRGLLRVRDELADLVTIQVTAFPQDGIFADEADDPNSRFLEVMADDTVKHDMQGRVTASHCTAMGSYEPYYSSKLHGFLRRAGINIVVNPFANSLIQGRLDPYPKRRGFAQLKELLAAGVNVSLGNDVIMDPWYLLGRADMVEAASLALHFTYMSGLEEIPEMLRCATERGARTLGVEDEYGIEEGKPADLVVYDAPNALEVLRLHPPRRWVIRRGRVVAETTPAQTTLLGEPVT